MYSECHGVCIQEQPALILHPGLSEQGASSEVVFLPSAFMPSSISYTHPKEITSPLPSSNNAHLSADSTWEQVSNGWLAELSGHMSCI